VETVAETPISTLDVATSQILHKPGPECEVQPQDSSTVADPVAVTVTETTPKAENPSMDDDELTEAFKRRNAIELSDIAVDLTFNVGKEAIKRAVIANLTHPDLQQSLTAAKESLMNMKRLNKIHQEKWDLLFPTDGGPPNVDKIDITLWVILARNVTVPFEGGKFKWGNKAPRECDVNWRHDVIRLREARNELSHITPDVLSEFNFKGIIDKVGPAIRRLGVSEECASRLQRHRTMATFQSFNREATITLIQPKEQHAGSFEPFKYMPRVGWRADPPIISRMDPLNLPAQCVVITHTVSYSSSSTMVSCWQLRSLQFSDMSTRGFGDIGLNFFAGNDGVIYEGRGWDYAGAFARGWNHKSIGIAFVGTFDEVTLPTDAALDAVKSFLKYLVASSKLRPDYELYAMRQIRPFPRAPGDAFYKLLQTWTGWTEYKGEISDI
jgi:N-acetylmuramoyl-L-alanine amidase